MTKRPMLAVMSALTVAVAAAWLGRPLPAQAVFASIDYPGAIATTAYGLRPTGDIVGDYVEAQTRRHGFLYRRGR